MKTERILAIIIIGAMAALGLLLLLAESNYETLLSNKN